MASADETGEVATAGQRVGHAALGGLLLLSLWLPPPLPAQEPAVSWDEDFFAEVIVGEWAGHGTVRGQVATASRHWRLDLTEHFLRADLQLEVEGSASRRALGYWSLRGEDAYRILWVDATGIERDFIARGEPADDEVTGIYFVDDGSLGRPPVMRRMTFAIEGPDRYVERIEERMDGGWEPIAELVFIRTGR